MLYSKKNHYHPVKRSVTIRVLSLFGKNHTHNVSKLTQGAMTI